VRPPVVVVFAGGTSAEREVSLGSGKACAAALARSFPTRLVVIESDALPPGLDPAREVVFSTLHGTFGEDGGMQGLLERAGIAFGGCDAAASALTMDKARCKALVAPRGVRGAEAILFKASSPPRPEEVGRALGWSLVVKPNNQGSSVGLSLVNGQDDLSAALAKANEGEWLIEQRVVGRELSVGVLGGRAMGVVEIRPKSGVYDYTSKYTKGMTEYLAPAPLPDEVAAKVRQSAEAAFAACGCRDYARVDFILSSENVPIFLEINTLPGMKGTSLLPMSARCAGLDFTALVREMIAPALARFERARASTDGRLESLAAESIPSPHP
jgi:D-alanine-D-alanine ligase